MSRPERLHQVEWQEFGEHHKEARYKTPARAARQAVAVLAAPDEIARLKGVWVSTGGRGRIEWASVDVDELIADVSEYQADTDDDEPEMTVAERLDTIRGAWNHYTDNVKERA